MDLRKDPSNYIAGATNAYSNVLIGSMKDDVGGMKEWKNLQMRNNWIFIYFIYTREYCLQREWNKDKSDHTKTIVKKQGIL